MIKVTLSEQPKEEKPFPKLMKNSSGCIRLVFENGDSVILKSVSANTPNGKFARAGKWNIESFTDYNEPVTLQNA